MKDAEIYVLKFFAENENISVEYYTGGKSYTIPTPVLLWGGDNSLTDYNDCLDVYINCSYQMQLGVPLLNCEIITEEATIPLEQISIPLNNKKLTKHQRTVMSLINTCSKRIIAQEMSRNKYALTAALESLNNNKQYS